MRYILLIKLLSNALLINSQILQPDMNYTKLSQSLLYAIRTGDSAESYIHQLAAADIQTLKKELHSDKHRKAFWLNIYNGFVQNILTENPGKYKKRDAFFKDKQIEIAGRHLSLDDIEHGILRRSKIKWSLGYLNKIFPSAFERKFRVRELDSRIHFALNCGAKSCPPIAFYDPEKIEAQLELATKSYLKTEVEYDSGSNIGRLPMILSWFRADFGGKKGIRTLLAKYGIVKEDADVKVKFKPYDWNLHLSNYKTE